MRLNWVPLALALAWGLNWPAVKILLSVLPPFTLRWLGMGLAALLLAAVALAQGRRLRPALADLPAITIGGGLTVAAFGVCTALAQLSTSTSRAAVLTFTMPLMAAVLAWAWLAERPGRRGALALAMGALGIAVLAAPVLQGRAAAPGGLPGLPGSPGLPGLPTGLLWPLLAALCWAAGTVAAKRWPAVGDRIALTAWQLALGAACTGLGAWGLGEHWPSGWTATVLAVLAFHVLISTALGYVLWWRLLASTTATVASLTTLAVPVVGVLGAMALVGDRPSALDWLGFVLVLAGAGLVLAPAAPPARHSGAG